MKERTTPDLLRLLASRDTRQRAWERDAWGRYSDSNDESMLEDIITTLANRIDGKEQGPVTKDPLESEAGSDL